MKTDNLVCALCHLPNCILTRCHVYNMKVDEKPKVNLWICDGCGKRSRFKLRARGSLHFCDECYEDYVREGD